MTTRAAIIGLTAALASMAVPAVASAAPVIQFNGTTGQFGNNTPDSTFTDTFNFVTEAGLVTINLFSFAMNAATNVDFNNNSALNTRPLDVVSTGDLEFRQTLQQRVSAGTQTLTVSGIAASKGTYSGTISFAAVPEPAVWGFMILGFAAVGGAMRRRAKVTLRAA